MQKDILQIIRIAPHFFNKSLSNIHPYMFVTRKKIPRILRLCKTCNKIEDEEHFILECTINSKLRTDLFAILANENPNFMQFSSEQKLIYLLNPTTTAHVTIIGFYIIRSLELRTEVS
jgi:hypothetical protein